MDDERIERLARELGDEEVAERLIAARGEVVGRVPDHVTRAHMGAIVAELRRDEDAAAGPVTTLPPVPSLGERRRVRAVDAGVLATRIAAGAIGIAVVTTGGLAAANALPAAAQTAVADFAEFVGLDRIGLDLPTPPVGPPEGVPGDPNGAADLGGVDGAPGQVRRDEVPGRSGRSEGPDRTELAPGRSGEATSRTGETPGPIEVPTGRTDQNTGRSDEAPSRSEDAPGPTSEPPAPDGTQRDRGSTSEPPADAPDDLPTTRDGTTSGQPGTGSEDVPEPESTPQPGDQGRSTADDAPAPSGNATGRADDAPQGGNGATDDAPGAPSGR